MKWYFKSFIVTVLFIPGTHSDPQIKELELSNSLLRFNNFVKGR